MWGSIITGVVALAGIGGTLWATSLTNKNAEKIAAQARRVQLQNEARRAIASVLAEARQIAARSEAIGMALALSSGADAAKYRESLPSVEMGMELADHVDAFSVATTESELLIDEPLINDAIAALRERNRAWKKEVLDAVMANHDAGGDQEARASLVIKWADRFKSGIDLVRDQARLALRDKVTDEQLKLGRGTL